LSFGWNFVARNLPLFAELLDNAEFVGGDYDTAIVTRMRS